MGRDRELRIVVGARFSSCAAALIPDLKGSRSILVVRCEKNEIWNGEVDSGLECVVSTFYPVGCSGGRESFGNEFDCTDFRFDLNVGV